jgi:predicted glycosyltransferase
MADAAPTAIVERSRADFQALLRRARVSVSQGGYNTVLDVLSSGARPVIVPFTGNGETEQRERGERLARLNVAVVLDDRALTPQALADAVDDAATRSFARFDFDCEGAAGTAEFFLRAFAEGRPVVRRAGIS